MSSSVFASAAVIGTGMMGPGIALTLALGGVRAVILGRTEESARRGLEMARTQAQVLAGNDLAAPEQVAAALARLDAGTALEATVAGVDLVIESAPEDLAFKQELFARLDALAPASAVLASNTSSLSITAIASACQHPERVMTTHFWNPPYLVPLVEIVKGEQTAPELALAVRDLLAACGKVPVIVQKDRPGQLGNRLQMALLREAGHMIAEGIATAEDIDLALKNGLGLRYPVYGLLEHQDIVGLALSLAVCEYVTRDLNGEPHAPPYLRELVARGDLGARTGQGFHDWSRKSAETVKARRDRFLIDFLRSERKATASSQPA